LSSIECVLTQNNNVVKSANPYVIVLRVLAQRHRGVLEVPPRRAGAQL
jgi:hypothetical protein